MEDWNLNDLMDVAEKVVDDDPELAEEIVEAIEPLLKSDDDCLRRDTSDDDEEFFEDD